MFILINKINQIFNLISIKDQHIQNSESYHGKTSGSGDYQDLIQKKDGTTNGQKLKDKTSQVSPILIIKSISEPCHEDPGDPISFIGFSMIDYPIPESMP